ncbi:hypothetical protein EZV62_019951 [Acer yangbiense]|uniref:Uncharacterized protein n=1 Tax=Acer yangbiense TaxID=1000413 RepID=A0A5C7HDK3_9ROSI|nr:hypothetical protein EZV62_019951 [Acer yangbiense]
MEKQPRTITASEILKFSAEFQYTKKIYPESKIVRQVMFQLLASCGKSIASMFGASVIIGSVSFQPHFAYAMDEHDILLDDYHGELSGASSMEESSLAFGAFVRKFWLPAFFLFTVLINWDHPIMLATKIIVLLFSTRPSPLSVYLYIDQSLYAKKVEVQDYKLLCIATVEVADQKLTLVGILGGWWALPSSQTETQGVFSVLRTLLRNKLV